MRPEINRHAVLVSLLIKYSDLEMASSRKLTDEQEERFNADVTQLYTVVYISSVRMMINEDFRGNSTAYMRC